jgi:acetylornithine/succinyldiaminopimelate/putrescine aminotransferase/predicted amino acid dehydrogenase
MISTSSRPSRAQALASVGLDVTYVKGSGSRLWYSSPGGSNGGRRIVWDFLGGYGSTFFGHNHPQLKQVVSRFLARDAVVHAQGSHRSATERLRTSLRSRLRAAFGREYEVMLGNTGAEAVEIAAKHASMVWARRRDEIRARLGSDQGPKARPGTSPRSSSAGTGAVPEAPPWTDEARETLGRMGLLRSGGSLREIQAHNRRTLGRGPEFLALRGGFHGMTHRALSLTDDPEERFGPGSLARAGVRFLDCTSIGAVEEALTRSCQPPISVVRDGNRWWVEPLPWTHAAALFLEPVQGEGGIHPIEPVVARSWSAACCRHRVPLIADEIQSGMGRTGSFLYCEKLGIAPDYVLLGKSLGGGLVKISAVGIAEEEYLPEFSLRHASTFAEDDLSSSVALRALELLDEEDALTRADEMGRRLLAELSSLARRFPGVIQEVRGQGLMIGVEWRRLGFERSHALRFLRDHGWLGYAISAFLLRRHGLRVAPTLSRTTAIRIEPAYALPPDAVTSLLTGLEDLCSAFARQDAAAIFGGGLAQDRSSARGTLPGPRANATPARPAGPLVRRPIRGTHVGFVGHFVDEESVGIWDPGLGRLGPDACLDFLRRVRAIAEPLVCHRDRVHSITGAEATLSFIGIPVSSEQCQEAIRDPRRRAELRGLIQRAVDLAAREGCSVVGLGGYCSILTRNGRWLAPRGTVLTTGNGYTVGAGFLALRAAAGSLGIDPAESRAVVVGALGNIGSVFSELLAREVRSLVLVGRDSREPDLRTAVERLRSLPGRAVIRFETSTSACRDADLVVAASNASGVLISPDDLGDHPTVMVDLAVPPDVDRSVIAGRANLHLVRGGGVRTPADPGWWVPGIALEPGIMFACMAETALMGLDRSALNGGSPDPGTLGSVTVDRVLATLALARRHGFDSVPLDASFTRAVPSERGDTSLSDWPPETPELEPWPRSTA